MDQQRGMFLPPCTIGNVLCCECGTSIPPNAANMCAKCLSSRVNITEGLQKRVTVVFCPECRRYLQPPKTWIRAEWESKELLTFCVKRLKLKDVRLVGAEFKFSVESSKRIIVKLTIQREVLHGAILEKSYEVVYVVLYNMCDSCKRIQANPDQWVASVQLRQKADHRRTFFYLEQLILKHNAASQAIRIKQLGDGIDFFFSNRSHGVKFIEFVGKVTPIKYSNDKKQLSHDGKSNIYNNQYTFTVDICPICREDLVCLPPKVAASFGNLGPLVICTKVSNSIALVDPSTLRHCYLDADRYWREPFTCMLSSRQLVEYIVLDIDVVAPEVNVAGSRYVLADAQVARVSDFGRNDLIFNIRTHLGHLLNPGDYALGYDLYAANLNNADLDKYKGLVLPDAILVKKSYEEKRQKKRGKPRSWKLKSLNMELEEHPTRGKVDAEKMNNEYEEFLRDLEENPELRFNISLYRNMEYQPSEATSVADGEDVPSVPLEELLADLELDDDDAGAFGDDDDVEAGDDSMRD
ncbi:hypothetical protein Droror1_Dr00004347 [Drosera rotundifolia]